ncbi:MAG: FAD-binding oxidoreductase [Cognatishimia sp.]|nr:FAD-binding oxidoreductase [Cognatishimia sp.]
MVDVTVYGAGIFGLSVAWSCVKRGAKVQVIDPNGVAAGSSGGIVGALAPHTPENWNDKKEFQFQSLIMAEDYWAKVADVSGQSPGYARSGRLQPIPDQRAHDLALTRQQGAADLWRGKASWDIKPAADFEGWCPNSPRDLVIHDTLSARIHPRQACAALAVALRAKGVEITADGAPKGHIVWATGWRGLLELSDETERPIGNGVKGQAILLELDRADLPQLFADALHVIPHADGTVAIGSTSERDFEDPYATDAQLDEVYQRAIDAVPALRNAPILARWAGVRPRAKSRAPILGQHPTRAGEFITNGGFKIGFGMAPRAGEVMADLILENRDAIPEGFRPEASL